jgi:hypothetical protein
MLPGALTADSFERYLPEARELAVANLSVLQKLPLALAPILLRLVIDYDWRFPSERHYLLQQLAYLRGLPPASFATLMAPFAAVRLPADIAAIDWIDEPQRFSEQLSAALWSMQEIDDYRLAAHHYQKELAQVLPQAMPATPRFTIVVIGQGVAKTDLALFRPLRPHGTLFTAVEPTNGWQVILQFVTTRATNHPGEYTHWYIDGGVADPACGPGQGFTLTSYAELAAAALQELRLTNGFVQHTGGSNKSVSPEAVQSFMAGLRPEDLGLQGRTHDAVLRHFEASVLTEGAGAQVFSTTFVQWSAREAMRRAQPLSMLARFAPRQWAAPMNELLQRDPLAQALDLEGSLVDADMGAYYTWINQARLPGAEQACVLVWHEGHGTALAIAPGLAKAATSDTPATLAKILQWMS